MAEYMRDRRREIFLLVVTNILWPVRPFGLQNQYGARDVAFLSHPQRAFRPLYHPRIHSRLSSGLNLDEGNEPPEGDEEGEKQPPQRNLFAGWIYGTDTSPLVEPIAVEDDDGNEVPPKVVRAKTDKLFSGMPGLTEILSDPSETDSDSSSDDDATELSDISSDNTLSDESVEEEDDSWFDVERDSIVAKYEEILREMTSNIDEEEEKREDVPDNAVDLVKTVLQQEMDRELTEVKDQRQLERLQDYEEELRADVQDADVSSLEPDEYVQQLMEFTESEFSQQESNRLEIEDFLKYEKEALVRGVDEDSIQQPKSTENLDQWAMDRLQDMEDAREDSDGDEMVRDLIQESMDDLSLRMKEQENRKQSFQPETLKEWQMYRSISTKMGEEKDPNNSADDGDDSKVLEQLESWRGYIEKEEAFRRDSGLTGSLTDPQPPENVVETRSFASSEKPSRETMIRQTIETRKTLNRMSIEALESLQETADEVRRAKLQDEIDFLKATLEGNDYLDVDESVIAFGDEQQTQQSEPIEGDELFQTYSPDEFGDDYVEDAILRPLVIDSPEPESPDPVYASDYPLEDEPPPSQLDEPAPPSPNTPFFTDDVDTNENSTESPFPNDESLDLSLGSMEDQKLEAMYRRAGARTEGERNALRTQWEEFQRFEEESRKVSGLSLDGGSELISSSNAPFNVTSVMKDDGDFDAEAILSSIGPRPSSSKKRRIDESGEGLDVSIQSEFEKEEVEDSLYRAVSAVGGGRYRDDPQADADQRASFQEFMEMENQMRESLEDPIPENFVRADTTMESDDGVGYAEEVLSSLGPRPQPQKTIKINPQDYSDRGGALADGTEEEEDDDDVENTEEDSDDFALGLMPEWLRRENEEAKSGLKRKTFRGEEVEEPLTEEDHQRNMQQLAEFQRRRSKRPQPMGIDITDVLGRAAYDTDDNADYQYEERYTKRRRSDWESDSFSDRKDDLLEYRELEVEQVNSLMDFRDSVHTTGVSQYMPRINKPFREFGAIFQLEGVLIDVSGFHFKAWQTVANEFGCKQPFMDDVEKAAVTDPEVAVKDVFFWTDNVLECKRMAAAHKVAMKEVFDTWMDSNSIHRSQRTDTSTEDKTVLSVDEPMDTAETVASTPLSEADLFLKLSSSWQETARLCNKEPPRDEDIMVAASVTPDIAVMQVFRWTTNMDEADRIVHVFQQTTNPERSVTVDKNDEEDIKIILSKEEVMEIHYKAWSMVADAFQIETPPPDEVLAAFVINDPEVAVEGFGWDSEIQSKAAIMFQKRLDELLSQCGYSSGVPTPAQTLSHPPQAPTPDFSEVFHQAWSAWSAVAKLGEADPPTEEEVLFALSVGPEDAIRNGFYWATEPDEVEEIVNMYLSELGRIKKDKSNTPKFEMKKSDNKADKVLGPTDDELYQAVFEAWTKTAETLEYPPPEEEEVIFAMTVGGEEAIVEAFQWTDDPGTITEIMEVYMDEIGKKRSKWADPAQNQSTTAAESTDIPLFSVREGARSWIESLLNVEMQCGVISYLEDYQMNALLEQTGLSDLLKHRVSSSVGYPTLQNQLLGAALRVERRPDHCVLFDCTPYGSLAAHDVEMQSVSFVGAYPRYELLAADSTAGSFELLSAMNIRRLFGERIYDQPQLETQDVQPTKTKRTKTKTKYAFDDD